LWIYLTCCRVLQAHQDPRLDEVLTSAQDIIKQQAAKITDPDLHYSFLNNVKTNQEILYLSVQGEPG
jgi:hypothetical protein